MNLGSALIGAGVTYVLTRGEQLPEAAVIGLSAKWLATVCEHNPTYVSRLYASDGVLVGTVAQSIKQGRPQIKTYFDKFLAKKNLCGTFQTHLIQTYPGWAIDSGTNTFSWDEGGKTVVVPARFTFVYRRTEDGWRIANHHSSALPE